MAIPVVDRKLEPTKNSSEVMERRLKEVYNYLLQRKAEQEASKERKQENAA